MNIAVLSGKGGTGKTTVSTNLSKLLKVTYIDCDVEEPNGFIFLKPDKEKETEVKVIFPVIDEEKCVKCGECSKACQFNALAQTKSELLLFPKLCHGCGVCELVCEYNAIHFEKRRIGIIEEGISGEIVCKQGILDIGEPMAVPVIKELLENVEKGINILDSPPGTSCNVVNILDKVQMAVLVTETTEFAFHDLKLAVSLCRNMNIPFGIVINKEINEENFIRDYCKSENIKVFGSIPYAREIAENYSKGEMLINNLEYRKLFQQIIDEMKVMIQWN